MWIYLLLGAGLFMGWSLGTNDAANAFGTAVATRVVKYRTAIIIIATMVVLGAILQGADDISKLSSIATNNEVAADVADMEKLGYVFEKDADGNYVMRNHKGEIVTKDGEYVIINKDAVEGIDKAGLKDLKIKSAVKAAIIFIAAAATVFVMSYLKFPVSANQAVTGAIIGWGLFYADYSNPEVMSTNLKEIGKFMSTWFINPVGAALIAFVIVYFFKKFFESKVLSLKGYDKVVKIGYIVAGAYSAYTIGINSSASVTAFYYDSFGVGANVLTSASLTAIIGGVAIAVGVLTYSKKVMMTVGGSIANITQIDGFLVILASALSITLMKELMGIPVSTSQAVVGAVVGAGLVSGVKNVNFGVFKRIAIAWVSSPTVAGLITYLVALATQSYFG
ncbi:MAG: inorganic phosphate transporter [Ruminococcaceae bacterium]|nr:inorganic phosphate transporter [Oscillospiraceae bacterium]